MADRDVFDNIADRRADLWPDYDGDHVAIARVKRYITESEDLQWMVELLNDDLWRIDLINRGRSLRTRASVELR